jgi:hypothetical protein
MPVARSWQWAGRHVIGLASLRPGQAVLVAVLVVAAPSFARAQSADLPPLPPPAEDGERAPAAPAPSASNTAPPSAAPAPSGARSGAQASGGSGDASNSDDSSESSEPPEPPDPWALHPFALEVQLGLGAPLGFAGIAIDGSPLPVFALNVGVGLGAQGMQVSGSARVRPFRFGHSAHFAPYIGGGISEGPYQQYDTNAFFGGDTPTAEYHWDTAVWANAEAGMEMRLGERFELRPFIGIAALTNPTTGKPVGTPDQPRDGSTAYTGIAIGYAF